MNRSLHAAVALPLLLLPTALAVLWTSSAASRLREAEAVTAGKAPDVALAAAANEAYCTPELKQILRRVLASCGLIRSGGGRGCQPLEAKNVATMSGGDFNALFKPMTGRGGIIEFERNSADLTESAAALLDRLFADRRGASYFFVVARASPEGSVEHNRDLSKRRAEAVLSHLEQVFHDPDIERQVGLLWLGEEYAQLDPSFCSWQRSGGEPSCKPTDINRSAFITWIDCRL